MLPETHPMVQIFIENTFSDDEIIVDDKENPTKYDELEDIDEKNIDSGKSITLKNDNELIKEKSKKAKTPLSQLSRPLFQFL